MTDHVSAASVAHAQVQQPVKLSVLRLLHKSVSWRFKAVRVQKASEKLNKRHG